MRTTILAIFATAAFATPAAAQNWLGTWSITPINYSCSQTNFFIDRLEILPGSGNSVRVRPLPQFPGYELQGTAGPNNLIASWTDTGFCDADYTIMLSFPTHHQCSGTFEVDFSPAWLCGSCNDQVWSVSGNRTATAMYAVIGHGCPGSLGTTHLVPQGWPLLGTTFQMQLDNLPNHIAFLVHGFSNTTSVLGPLPMPLDPFGMTGCIAYTSLDGSEFLLGANHTATWSLTLPNAPGLLGVEWYQQALVPDPGVNALGAVMSQARVLTVGNT